MFKTPASSAAPATPHRGLSRRHLLAALPLAGAALVAPRLLRAAHDSHHPAAAPAAPAAQETPGNTSADHSELNDLNDLSDLSNGEITRWDPRTLKVTIRHGEIKNLGMPPMTMVFRVNDASMLAPFQPGDKVLFRVEQQSGGYFITRMEAAR